MVSGSRYLREPSRSPRGPDHAGGVAVSEWGGARESELLPGESRAKTVWIDSTRVGALSESGAVSAPQVSALFAALSANESLTVVHEQDDFLTEWNAVSASGLGWGRVRRYDDVTLNPDHAGSVVYEDAIGCVLEAQEEGPAGEGARLRPLVSVVSVQQSVDGAKNDAWVRVVGVAKFADTSCAFVQEWDGQGALVAMQGGELRPQFLLEVVMSFSSAMFRGTHAMFMEARYGKFRHRFATWDTQVKGDMGPSASQFHASLGQAFSGMGFPEAGAAVVRQLERVNRGFASGDEQQLFSDARAAADAPPVRV